MLQELRIFIFYYIANNIEMLKVQTKTKTTKGKQFIMVFAMLTCCSTTIINEEYVMYNIELFGAAVTILKENLDIFKCILAWTFFTFNVKHWWYQ